ncbi:MAG: SDR family oxidoreductase [Burkholderiales bacterium]|jgi:nucleoside-diphosphate-sugar epimerase|nr:SDR family oxidoreductase [Burkholderiales bacterium]
MTTLVLGASGATGKHLVEQLLLMGQHVKVVVRPLTNIPNAWNDNDRATIIRANISEMTVDEIANHIKDCQAIASCLGHGSTIYGKPRKLVTDAVKILCSAVEKNASENVKIVLMNTAGFRNKDLNERISFGQRIMMGIIRTLVPPHLDNEEAAEFLRLNIGQKNAKIQWVVVRPDNLTNEENVTEYSLCVSPTSTLFNPSKISRINVGHFMARLIVGNDLWKEWKGKMPVICNAPQKY